MKTYNIILADFFSNKIIEKTETFQGSIEDLKKRLFKLQVSYSSLEKPEVDFQIIKSNNRKIKCLVASSNSDFHYLSPI